GRVLAAAGSGLDAGLQPCRHGVAPPPEFAAHVLETADRIRPRRGDAGAEMAREVQRPGARALGRPHLRQRADARAPVAPGARLSRHLGPRAVSVALRARAELAWLAAADAGMAPGVRARDGTVGARLLLDPAHAFVAVAHRRRPASAGLGMSERRPRLIPCRASRQRGPSEEADVDGSAPSGSAARPTAWAAQRGPHSLALPRRLTTSTALARDDLHVERALAGSGP